MEHSSYYTDNVDVFYEDDDGIDVTPGTSPDYHVRYHHLRRASALIGASTVAIDNKIEQAMDLVKSHLMFAVREEVEVLKEQIKELLEKNSQLEYENSVLRSSASNDTLSKLTPGTSSQQPQAPTTSS